MSFDANKKVVVNCTNNYFFLWILLGSNQRPSDYESDALTD